MYDRAPRLLRLAEGGSTEEHVGPGSYQVPSLKRQATGGCAPFLSSSTRESTFTIASDTEKAVPGPGHYNVSKAQYNIKGGGSLQNREKRFKKFISDNPGPASYDQSYPGTLNILNRKKISRASTINRSIDVPSIPSCGQSYGYNINEDGSIIKRFPPANDNTLGPAYYKPQFVSIIQFGSSFIIVYVSIHVTLTNTPANFSGFIQLNFFFSCIWASTVS
ncbi:Sperm-tail PG-rich repeat-containing protein 2 [Sciurus carolinensis]|uniref:Sperm-tail PG-rich repeat-containing protein 2 n=1 Tax=Sciurus carolinensis TaxID=30640 RepID=A0AA41T4F4_SCICA|nr:Sperm-tail PG-rich repeat-containing protein 2 [Sciurus carolinensis]